MCKKVLKSKGKVHKYKGFFAIIRNASVQSHST